MSDTQKRDEMLDCHSSVGRDHPYHEAMAEEMERLRNQLYLANESARSSSAEAARLGRIIAALREPSLALEAAGHQAYVLKIGQIYADEGHVARHHQTLAINSAIRAAVAAAEKEVGRE